MFKRCHLKNIPLNSFDQGYCLELKKKITPVCRQTGSLYLVRTRCGDLCDR